MASQASVVDKKEQAQLYVYGVLGHDFCREEMKSFNLCHAQIPAVQAAPEICEKQADVLLGKFFELKQKVNSQCPQEFKAVTEKLAQGLKHDPEMEQMVKCFQR